MERSGLEALAAARNCATAELHVIVVDATAIAALNKNYLGHHGVTDVLAFDLHTPSTDHAPCTVFGEIYVCLDVAVEAAVTYRTSVAHEVVLYIVHGMLHLAGYDDRTDTERAAMRREERRILEQLRAFSPFEDIF